MNYVRCEIVRWLDDEPQPGWVEFRFADAQEREWVFQDKPIWTPELVTKSTPLPIPAALPCDVLSRSDERGPSLVTIRVSDLVTELTDEIEVDAGQIAIFGPSDAEALQRARELHGDEVEFMGDDVRATFVGRETPEELSVRRALRIGNMVLLETSAKPDNWYMGRIDESGIVRSWGAYGDLETALRGL